MAQLTMGCIFFGNRNNEKRELNMEFNKAVIVSIEGNIGVGKSTLIEKLSEIPGLNVASEPIQEWQSIDHPYERGRKINLFELMYKNKQRYTFPFEVFVMLTQLRQHMEATHKVRVIERALGSLMFIRHAAECGNLSPTEVATLNEWKNFIYVHPKINMGPKLVVYLKATPEKALQRIRSRGRPEERDIDLRFLREIHKLHEDWLIHRTICTELDLKILVINVDDENEADANYEIVKREILALIAAEDMADAVIQNEYNSEIE